MHVESRHLRESWATIYKFNMAAIRRKGAIVSVVILWSADMLFISTTKNEEGHIAKETNSQ